MITITLPDRATEKLALGFLLGRFSARVLKSGKHLVPEAALETLAEHNISFRVEDIASMTNKSNYCQLEVHYSGRVQGVGFRYTVRHIAERFDVTGYVENLRDGRVQLVVEGNTDALKQFVDAVQDELGRYIKSIHSTPREATGAFHEFRIRH